MVSAWSPSVAAGAGELVPDASFGDGGTAIYEPGFTGSWGFSKFVTVGLGPEGKIYAAGVTGDGGGTFEMLVARAQDNGSPDPSFGNGGAALWTDEPGPEWFKDNYAEVMSVEPDGSVTVQSNSQVVRFTPNGGADPSYGSSSLQIGGARELVHLANGDLAAAGGEQGEPHSPAGVEELLPNGTPDPAFGQNGIATIPDPVGPSSAITAESLMQLSDGSLLVKGGGTYSDGGDEPTPFEWLARLTPSGGLDGSFGQGGIVNLREGEGRGSLQPLPGGFALVGTSGVQTQEGIDVWGFDSDGARNPSFGKNGVFEVPLRPGGRTLGGVLATVDPAGRILLVSSETTPTNSGEGLFVRIKPNGQLDSAFGQDGIIHEQPGGVIEAVTIDPRGRILLAGWTNARRVPEAQKPAAFIERLIPRASPSPTSVAPSASSLLARVKRLLARQIYPRGHHATVRSILRGRGWTLSLNLAAAGKLRVDWWARPGKHGHRLLLAYGRVTVGANGRKRMRVRLTKVGRRFLRTHTRGMSATASAAFDVGMHTDVQASRRFRLP